MKNWNQQYTNFCKGKDKLGEQARTWRDNLPEMLRNLSNILDIDIILNEIRKDLTPQPPSLRGKGEQDSLLLSENGEPDSPPLAGEGLGERSIQNLILIPHRDLHRFPLHALFPPKFTITYLPSAKIGLIPQTHLENRGDEQHNLLSIEHPNSEGYPPLEFAQIESEAISQMFPNPTRKRSEKATKAAIINALPQHYSILHFTGHGEYNFQNPALSHLALAGEDKLTLADIRNLNLQSYQLVTLAACETAITGNYTITTEYVGLVSGFMGCGVAHVVSTLWTVESAASALMMIQFYQLLQQGKSEAVALAEATQWLRNVTNAQLAEWYAGKIATLPQDEGIIRPFLQDQLNDIKIRQTTDQPYNHHYHWAAFTIIGVF